MSSNLKPRSTWHEVGHNFDAFAVSLGRKFDFRAATISGASGEFINQATDGDITGNPGADIAIKVGVPILTGVVVPLAKEIFDLVRKWLQDRKEERELRRLELEKANEQPGKNQDQE